MNSDLDRARDALQFIPPDLPRDEWVRVGMACHAAGLSFEDFDAWSSHADSYKQRDAQSTWKSFRVGKGVNFGTLLKMASDRGRRDDGKANLGGRVNGGSPALEQTAVPPKPTRPGVSAAEVWGRCVPATADHGYIAAKAGQPDGLRVVPVGDLLRIAGQSMVGALVVPVLPLGGGDPVSLQFIGTPELAARWKASGLAGKLNLPSALMGNGAFVVGNMVAGGTVFVCEGIGQAWACRQATDDAAVVCFGAGRMSAVASELHHSDSSARLVLVADRGKEVDTMAIAGRLSCQFVLMPEDWKVNDDVWTASTSMAGRGLVVVVAG
jgi:putative DNA primase/helicase